MEFEESKCFRNPDLFLRHNALVPAETVGSREKNFLALDLTVPIGAEPFCVQQRIRPRVSLQNVKKLDIVKIQDSTRKLK